jgi:UDP-N-acetylglucosamine acyltransferase
MTHRRVHPTALVDPAAHLGDGVEIGPWATIEACEIGDGSVVGPNTVLKAGVQLGRGVRIGHSSLIGVTAAELTRDLGARIPDDPPVGGPVHVRVGDGAIIRDFTTVCAGEAVGAESRATCIGVACHIMSYIVVGPSCRIGDRAFIANTTHLGACVEVGPGAGISGVVVVATGIRVGRLAFVSGMSQVFEDVPPFMIAEGHPACLYGLNKVGLQRAAFTAEAVRSIKRAYQLLFRDGLDLAAVSIRVRSEFDPAALAAVGELLKFVEAAPARIARPRRAVALNSAPETPL